MKNILLIGLGRFGRHIALQLNKLGHEVMAVDSNEERVNEILPIVTNAQIGDSTNTEFLKSLGIGNLSLIHISEPTRQAEISYAVFCLKKKKNKGENQPITCICQYPQDADY